MPSPVLPEHVRAVVPTGDEPLCDQIVMFMKLMVLVWQYHKYKYTNTGAFTPEYEQELCAISCPQSEVDTDTTT